jgi:hypothetical protein
MFNHVRNRLIQELGCRYTVNIDRQLEDILTGRTVFDDDGNLLAEYLNHSGLIRLYSENFKKKNYLKKPQKFSLK